MFTTANIATDHNQLTMEMLKKIALKHDLVCLLHEKPFACVNGSGKHVNWSLATSQGRNLLEPGHTPHENVQFLVFLCAVLKGVDQYARLLCASAASAGNDHRLGANEAPPPLISVFLGSQLTEILERIASGGPVGSLEEGFLKIGVTTLPALPKDSTDRNRTSPFAFTGNKFEFRMVGSSASIAATGFCLNTIVAEVLAQIADRLEKTPSFETEVIAVIREIVKEHGRIIFNGNNYSAEWATEAEKRGLPHVCSAVEALQNLIAEDTVALFAKHGVLNRYELESRHEINLANYIKTVNIESLTMLEMAKRQIVPAAIGFVSALADSINAVKKTGVPADVSPQEALLQKVSSVLASFCKNIEILEDITKQAAHPGRDAYEAACFYHDHVLTQMAKLRADGDQLEVLVDEKYWPMPTYGDLLFRV
jgi:glutamine synthetase